MVLSMTIVRVRDSLGGLQVVRVLLDSSSQVSTITSDCPTRLGLRRIKSRIGISGFSQQPVNKVKGVTQCQFVSFHTEEVHFCVSSVIIFTHVTMQLYPVLDADT